MNENCKFKNTDRTGLYILIISIVMSVVFQCPGCGDKRYNELKHQLDRIEAKTDSLLTKDMSK